MLYKVRTKLIASGAVSLLLTGSAAAQCAMCRATLAGNPQAAAASHQMNIAVLFLLIPAIVIFTGFFLVMYRYRNHFRNSPPDTGFRPGGHGGFDHDGFDPFRT